MQKHEIRDRLGGKQAGVCLPIDRVFALSCSSSR